jgi:hypothetical protein
MQIQRHDLGVGDIGQMIDESVTDLSARSRNQNGLLQIGLLTAALLPCMSG